MSTQPIGVVENDGEYYSLSLERNYPVPIDNVWRALVEPEKLQQWLGTVAIDARQGGSFEIDFNGTDKAGGAILHYDPPRVLEFEWGERDEPSIVRFELRETALGTRLRLTHSLQSAEMARGTGAGWHAHVDLLEAQVLGYEAAWETVYAAALPRYQGSVQGERSPAVEPA